MDVDLQAQARLRTGAPGAVPIAGDFDSRLREWGQRTGCSQKAQVIERIQQWRAAANPSSPLDLTHCDLEDCPPLPDDVQNLNLSWNPRLDALPQVLPDNLVTLAVMFCDLSVLPTQWPQRLETLLIASNRILALSETLPDSVRTIGAANNRVEQLPEHLPSHLESLGIGTNRIVRVPMQLLSRPNLKNLALANNPLTPVCVQELRQATALPDYGGPTLTIGTIGDDFDASEILPASRRDETVRIVPAHPSRAQVSWHLRQGAQYVATYADRERSIVQPMYRSAQSIPHFALHLSDDSSEES